MEIETPAPPALDKFRIIAFSFTLALEPGLVMATESLLFFLKREKDFIISLGVGKLYSMLLHPNFSWVISGYVVIVYSSHDPIDII